MGHDMEAVESGVAKSMCSDGATVSGLLVGLTAYDISQDISYRCVELSELLATIPTEHAATKAEIETLPTPRRCLWLL
jgi:hypothetical protein